MGSSISRPKSKRQHSEDGTQGSRHSNEAGRHSTEVAPFVYNLGRRYHGEKQAPYNLPNDLGEADRMDALHYALRYMLNGICVTKLHNPQRVLDVGTGTGTWAMEMASEYPGCEVTGIDISNIQPQAILPSNVQFEMMNVLNGIAYNNNRFDYVHMRFINVGIPEARWPTLIEELARVCVIGGTIEVIDTSAMLCNAGPLGQKVNQWFTTATSTININVEKIWDIPAMMQAAGLHVERVHYLELPMGEWVAKLGALGLSNLLNLIESVRPKLINICQITNEEIDCVVNDHAHRSYWRIGVFIARKR
ncbi:S-adenosyl-L-methionine-dependent methyltransferase [Syncephalis plumigaleata]|nr:S-adenosyl-L-methionine-dependent methyltransferase [Syncephalis plumigaleata]